MAHSQTPGPLLHFGPWAPARTPGPLGWLDHADSGICSLLGDTPGTLGIGDLADPTLFSADLNRHLFGGVWRLPDGTPLALPQGTQPAAVAPGALSAAALQLVFTQADAGFLQQVADEVNADPPTYGLDTALRRAHFFAQVRQEAGAAMTGTVESFNYAPDRLKVVFKYYKDHPDEATTDGREVDPKTKKVTRAADQETIANKVYGGRPGLGNGDAASGDGWSFRGRGLKQVTGRANYASTTKRYKLLYPGSAVDFEATPDLMAEFPYNLRSAVCFWIENGLHTLADAGGEPDHVDAITKVMNLYTDSYAARRAHFVTAWAAFK